MILFILLYLQDCLSCCAPVPSMRSGFEGPLFISILWSESEQVKWYKYDRILEHTSPYFLNIRSLVDSKYMQKVQMRSGLLGK